MSNLAMTPQQWLDLAIEHHRAGRLAQAEPLYRQLLAHEPNHPDLLHLLGLLGCEAGHPQAGLELMERSIALRPQALYFINYSTQTLALGRLEAGLAAAREAVRLEPDYATSQYQLGVALQASRQWDEAAQAYRAALALDPEHTLPQLNFGNVLKGAGRLDEAEAWYREALKRRPADAALRINLGSLCHERGRLAEEVELYREALAFEPQNALVRNNLAVALKDQGDLEGAVSELRRALALDPMRPGMHSNLILTLLYLDSPQALAEEQQAWNRQFARETRSLPARDRNPERRLRIGYVSHICAIT